MNKSGINWQTKKNKQLLQALLALENSSEAECFLRDLMTEKEIQEFANRLEAAKLLSEKVQYNTIIEDTGLSSTTIARISKWLKGSLGGYRLVLNRLSNKNSAPRQSSGQIYPINLHHSHPTAKLGKGLSFIGSPQ